MHFRSLLILLFTAIITGCASIVSKSTYPVSINSSPSEAGIVIKNRDGMTVFEGSTPVTLPLKASAGYFKRAIYQVEIALDGYETTTFTIDARVDGWYFGNIVFGGFIGLLIIDPLTGAMYKLPTEYFQMKLRQSPGASTKSMQIITIDEVPESLRDKLELIEKSSKS